MHRSRSLSLTRHISTSIRSVLFRSNDELLLLSCSSSSCFRCISRSFGMMRLLIFCGGCQITRAVHGLSIRARIDWGRMLSTDSLRISSHRVIRWARRNFSSRSMVARVVYGDVGDDDQEDDDDDEELLSLRASISDCDESAWCDVYWEDMWRPSKWAAIFSSVIFCFVMMGLLVYLKKRENIKLIMEKK